MGELPSSTSSVTVRKALQSDADAIADIWLDGWHDGHRGLVPHELVEVRTPASFTARAAARIGDTTVATVDGTVAGFVMVVGDEVEQVYVSSLHRGTGVAAALMAEAERGVRANGHTTAWLAVVAGNARARAFYLSAGWRDEGRFVYSATSDSGAIDVPCHRYTKFVGSGSPDEGPKEATDPG